VGGRRWSNVRNRGMKVHTMKIAVSLPERTMRGVEIARKRFGRTRSSIVAEALDAWLAAHSTDERDRRYLEGYERWPEPEDGAIAAAVMGSWDSWEKPSTANRRRVQKRRERR
jgi:hypothetical protein